MKHMLSLRRKLFYGFTFFVVAFLLISPASGWLSRLQLLPFTVPGAAFFIYEASYSAADYEARSAKAVARGGNDFTLRYADALCASSDTIQVMKSLRRLDELNTAFPQNPLVISAVLKTMTQGPVTLQREETILLTSQQPPTNPYLNKTRSDPAQVAKFIAFSEAGEKLEPQNAYFAVMTAYGYFVARDDDKAVAAWFRAAKKSQWNDYVVEEVRAKWSLHRAMNDRNEPGAILRMGTLWSISYPQFARIRRAAEMASVKAIQAELQRDTEKGFALRRANRLIGQNMQTNSTCGVGNRLGQRIVNSLIYRHGGEPYRENPYLGDRLPDDRQAERWSKRQRARYVEYLRSIGHPEEASAYNSAASEGEKMRALDTKADAWGHQLSRQKLHQLFGAWCVNFLTLAGALFSMVFACIFKLVYRFSPRLQKSEPLQNAARWGVTMGFTLPFVAGITGQFINRFNTVIETKYVLSFALFFVVFCLVIPPALLRLSWREVGHGLLVMIATLFAFVALYAAVIVCLALVSGIFNALGMFPSLATENPVQDLMDAFAPWVVGAVVLSVPAGLLLLFAVFSRVLRVPVAAGVTRGMRATGVPLACVLMLLWSGTLLRTLRIENTAIHEMERMAAMGKMQYLKTIDVKPSAK